MSLFTCSISLFYAGPYPLGHPGYDRVFLLASVFQADDGRYHFVITDDTPVVRLNEKVGVEAPTVKEVAASREYSLFSANVMLYIEDYGYPVLKRDAGAPVYPDCYTCSAGRCEQSPRNTAIAELNQEVAVFVKNTATGEIRILGYNVNYDVNEVALLGKAHKEKYMKRELPELLVVPVTFEKGPDKYAFEYRDRHGAGLNDQIIETGTARIVYDKATNTYEICFKAFVVLPEGWEVVSVEDGEGFGREASFVKSLAELAGRPVVPALKAFIG